MALLRRPAIRPETWLAFRIVDGRFEPFSALGASMVGGRWNSPGRGVVHASRTFAGAMLECLAHAGIGRIPKTHGAIEISIPGDVSVEHHDEGSVPAGWNHRNQHAARAFGDEWLSARRSAVLVVPSMVARREGNVLLDPLHSDFKRIVPGRPEPVVWDARLFGRQ